MSRYTLVLLSILILAIILLAACQPKTPSLDVNAQITLAVQTALASIRQTQTAEKLIPTETSIPTPTVQRTPPALPPTFSTSSLNPLDEPHTYIQDSCQYLKDKWTSTNAVPGTVVMVVMIHGIEKGEANVTDPKNISSSNFKIMMNNLHDQGFQAIYTQQLADFLEHNAKIPPRSVVLIQDDRHQAQNFTDHFRSYWENWQWPVINGWISLFGGQDPFLQENVALSKEGWVDYQAHGVIHNIPMSDRSTDEFITGELQGSITNIQKYFNKTPIAIIWPGGGFGVRPVQFARKFGYQLGFTTNQRGPLMYNWIPLANQPDPQHPDFISEGPVNDPLMTLPRYWDTDVRTHIDEVRQIGNDASAYAQQNKATELEYYDIVCAPTYGPIP